MQRRLLTCILTASVLSGIFSGSTVSGNSSAVSTVQDQALPLPSRWDVREHLPGPVVKSQGSYGTCWALAATSALETSWQMQRLRADEAERIPGSPFPVKDLVFSADHMALNNRFSASLADGGDYVMVMAYLSGWQGPVLEAEDPYGDAFSPDGLSPAVHTQEIDLLRQASTEELKEAILTTGAVQTSLYMDRSLTRDGSLYYNPETSAYYYPEAETPSHDVILIGWDDRFPRSAFTDPPQRDGAFLCQNSWGEDFGEEGVFYVSYEDASIGQTAFCFPRIDKADNYDRIYQTDSCGWQGQQGYADETCWFANVYTSRSSEEPELLRAFGLYTTGPDTVCELYIVHDFEKTASFADRKYLQTVSLKYAGYHTLDLDIPEELAPAETFALVVKITTPDASNPVAVEYRADRYTEYVTTYGKEGYLSPTGDRWENTEHRYGSNVCLKAYTSFPDIK